MTQQNKTDNVLYNREKLGKLRGLALGFQQFLERKHGGIDNVDDGILLVKQILAMPDFIESERDVERVKQDWNASADEFNQFDTLDSDEVIQAAINALQYRKDGE